MTRGRPGILRGWGCPLSLLAAILIVLVVIPSALRKWMRENRTPAQLAFIDQMYEPPDFPATWAHPEPVSESLAAAMKRFTDAYVDQNDASAANPGIAGWDGPYSWPVLAEKMAAGQSLSDDEREALSTQMEHWRRVIDTLVALAAQPDYDAEVWDISTAAAVTGAHLRIRVAVSRALVEARFLHSEGRTTEGLALATSLLPLAQHHRAGTASDQSFTFGSTMWIHPVIADIVAGCDDANALRAVLDAMNRVDARTNAPLPDDLIALHYLGNLRAQKRDGFPVDIDFRKPVATLMDTYFDAFERYPKWKLDRIQPDHPQHAEYVRKVESAKQEGFEPPHRMLVTWTGPYGNTFREMMLSLEAPDTTSTADWGITVVHKAAAAHFHLARLAVAERLAQLEGQPAPEAAADLVPRYLPTEPLDPFTSAPFVRSPKGGFHSVGPDRVDDAATILFDSSKGTTSTGDIFLRR